MSSKNYLEAQRQRVEEALERLLPPFDECPALLSEAMRYGVLSGGKRVRPILTLTASEAVAGSGDPDAALNAAVAVELIHSYTLIHDDLPSMDNDLIRRGMPTVHAKYGEALAILAGDALQAYAFDVASRPTNLATRSTLRIVNEIARAAGPLGVVGGQVEDTIRLGEITAERLAYVHQRKTADLFRIALRVGAIAGGGDEEAVDALSAFGNNLGIAFQIIDDLIDAPEGAPLPEELSCLRVWTRDEVRRHAKSYTTAAVSALSLLPGSQASAAMADLAEDLLSRIA